jgi:hypothetical protein
MRGAKAAMGTMGLGKREQVGTTSVGVVHVERIVYRDLGML